MIRHANSKDLEQLTILFDLYRQFYKLKSNLEGSSLFLTDRLKNKDSVILLAADQQQSDKIVGFVQLYPLFSSLALKNSWLLNDLYVEASVRKQGFGKSLLEASINFSAQSGASGLMLQTAKANETAQKLYEKMGWIKDEKFLSYYHFHTK